jgi:NitT/TauT family transport system substrate-binding protein
MPKIRPLHILLLIPVILILTACQGIAPVSQPSTADTAVAASEPAPEPQGQQADLPDIGPIKIGYLPISGSAPLFLAQEKGYFAEQGLEVELIPFRTGSEMIVLLSTGQLDLGAGNGGAAMFNALASDFSIKLVAGFIQLPEDNENATIFLVVRKALFDSGEVTEVADLAGRKITINTLRGTSEYLVAQALAQAGLSLDDVEMVVLPLPEIPPALANGAVDGAYLFEPFSQQSFADGISVPLLSGTEIAGQVQVATLIAGTRLLEPDNREITVRTLAAIYKAIRQDLSVPDFLKDEEISSIVQQYTNLPLPVIQNTPPDSYTDEGRVDEETLNRLQTYYLEQGYLDYTELISPDGIADSSFVEEAVQRLEQAEE